MVPGNGNPASAKFATRTRIEISVAEQAELAKKITRQKHGQEILS